MAKDSLEVLSRRYNLKFDELYSVCVREFGQPRKSKGKHNHIFKTGIKFEGFGTLNIQADKNGDAKPYQIDQVVRAIRVKREEYDQ